MQMQSSKGCACSNLLNKTMGEQISCRSLSEATQGDGVPCNQLQPALFTVGMCAMHACLLCWPTHRGGGLRMRRRTCTHCTCTAVARGPLFEATEQVTSQSAGMQAACSAA